MEYLDEILERLQNEERQLNIIDEIKKQENENNENNENN
jgi:hypothetical protein